MTILPYSNHRVSASLLLLERSIDVARYLVSKYSRTQSKNYKQPVIALSVLPNVLDWSVIKAFKPPAFVM